MMASVRPFGIVLELLLNLLHLRGSACILHRVNGLFTADGKHQAAHQHGQQDDAHAVAQETQMVQQEVHDVRAGEQSGPTITRIGR